MSFPTANLTSERTDGSGARVEAGGNGRDRNTSGSSKCSLQVIGHGRSGVRGRSRGNGGRGRTVRLSRGRAVGKTVTVSVC